jgi:putative FmdB family regulatory protein
MTMIPTRLWLGVSLRIGAAVPVDNQPVPLESWRSTCHPDGWRQVAAEADTYVAVWTPIDEGAARFGGSEMPTYEFECRDCQKRFDVIALITEHGKLKDQPPTCPQCGQTDTRQLASLFNCKTASASF